MYWKMSIDLSYPLVPSMGQLNPLDGFITYNELIENVPLKKSDLNYEINDMVNICRKMSWNTTRILLVSVVSYLMLQELHN